LRLRIQGKQEAAGSSKEKLRDVTFQNTTTSSALISKSQTEVEKFPWTDRF